METDDRPWFARPVKDETAEFFRSLGYQVDWDFSARDRLRWYEISDDKDLIVQIDFGVPLAHLIEDMDCWAKDLPTTSASDYEIRTPRKRVGKKFRALCVKAVAKLAELNSQAGVQMPKVPATPGTPH